MMTFACLGRGSIGSHGRTTPLLQVRIVDEDGADVPDGEVGEIVGRGPTVMNGYWNRPEENARRSRDGWHHTNDLGRREADGSVTFVGPKGRMIKSAAENIYPVEVERCLARARRPSRRRPSSASPTTLGAERQGHRRAARRCVGDRRRARRALPYPDRVVQEAALGRVRRRASPERLPRRLRRARRARSAAATTPAAGPAAHDARFPDGSYRRRLRMVVAAPTLVEAGLEDDFHHFTVALSHDGTTVTSVDAERAPLALDHVPRRRGPTARARRDGALAALPRGRGRRRSEAAVHAHVRPRGPRRRARHPRWAP